MGGDREPEMFVVPGADQLHVVSPGEQLTMDYRRIEHSRLRQQDLHRVAGWRSHRSHVGLRITNCYNQGPMVGPFSKELES